MSAPLRWYEWRSIACGLRMGAYAVVSRYGTGDPARRSADEIDVSRECASRTSYAVRSGGGVGLCLSTIDYRAVHVYRVFILACL